MSFSTLSLFFLSLTFVFFFKQKTAYEMRISDWSSDVCSSDLRLKRILTNRNAIERSLKLIALGERGVYWAGSFIERHALFRNEYGIHEERQIGRASCRERVCQYV